MVRDPCKVLRVPLDLLDQAGRKIRVLVVGMWKGTLLFLVRGVGWTGLDEVDEMLAGIDPEDLTLGGQLAMYLVL